MQLLVKNARDYEHDENKVNDLEAECKTMTDVGNPL